MIAWLESIGLKALFDWLWEKLTGAWAAYKKQQAAHQADVDQAAQDTAKAQSLAPQSSSTEVSNAIDDELNHL